MCIANVYSCLYVHVCIHVCMCVCMCIEGVYALCMHVYRRCVCCVYASVHAHVYAYMYACVYVRVAECISTEPLRGHAGISPRVVFTLKLLHPRFFSYKCELVCLDS